MTRPTRREALFCAALLVASLAEQAATVGLGWEDALKVPGCAALAYRRAFPVAACLAVLVLFGAGEFVDPGDAGAFTTFLAIVPAIFAVALHARTDRILPGCAGAAVLVAAVSIEAGFNDDAGMGPLETIVSSVLFALVVVFAPVVAIGLAARRQAELRRRLGEQAEALERERERHAAAAVAAERARMAADLHDAVGAGVRDMLAGVDAARRAIRDDPAGAAGAVQRVEERGRAALAEMRALLGVLRRGDEDLALAPQPSLTRLDALARSVTSGGLGVALRVEGRPVSVSPGLDVAAYRVVEDALSRASGAARADVVVRWTDAAVEVEVGVDGPQLADAGALGGVRERVALFDGRLDAGRRPRGGSAVRIGLPVRAGS